MRICFLVRPPREASGGRAGLDVLLPPKSFDQRALAHIANQRAGRGGLLPARQLPAATRNFYVDGHVPQPH